MPLKLGGNLTALQRMPGFQTFLLLLLPLRCGEQQPPPEAGTDAFRIRARRRSDLCRHQAAVAQQRIQASAQILPRLLRKPADCLALLPALDKPALHGIHIRRARLFLKLLPLFLLLLPVSGKRSVRTMMQGAGQAELQQRFPLFQQGGNHGDQVIPLIKRMIPGL